MVEGLKSRVLRRSMWVFHFNSGGCNGCDIEFMATLTPKYDIERLEVTRTSSPKQPYFRE